MAQVLFESKVTEETPIDVTGSLIGARRNLLGNQFYFDGESGNWSHSLLTTKYPAIGAYVISMVSGDSEEYSVDPTCEVTYVVE